MRVEINSLAYREALGVVIRSIRWELNKNNLNSSYLTIPDEKGECIALLITGKAAPIYLEKIMSENLSDNSLENKDESEKI